MSIKNNIVELLVKEELTSSEISERLGVKSDKIWVYLNTLFKENKVERITDKKPYVYRAITPLARLRRLIKLMNEKMDFIKPAINEDLELIEQIEEMIK
ncbi:hypothetical protein LCGC14_2759850 [marine sediment metagenome]|uniref:Transcription regulator TrmB N-terminal domain-containing protein n=1 Tax=marine sediment metagenome TaxID=412755 RepID=A0A0F8YZB9_9ZZZZ